MKKHARALLAAGNKYDVQNLVGATETHLAATVTPANAIEMLLLADKHNASNLRKKAMKVIIANFAKISKQSRWIELKAANCSFVSLIEISVENLKI